MPYQTGLPAALKARGLKVETVPGWETRGSSSFNPKGAVCHWTAGPRGTTKRPSLAICTNGRAGLPGPLCNVYLDRSGIAVVVAAGRANHAGIGGWKGLTGNSSVFGTEAESAGNEDWTPEQLEAYPKVNAAYADLGKFTAENVCGHNEWAPSRKIDIQDWPMTNMRKAVSAVLSGQKVEPEQEEEEMIVIAKNANGDDVWVGNGIVRTHIPDGQTLSDLKWVLNQAGQKVTELASVANLNALGLPAAVSLTEAEIRRVVSEEVTKVVRSEGISGAADPAKFTDFSIVVEKAADSIAKSLAARLSK